MKRGVHRMGISSGMPYILEASQVTLGADVEVW